MPPVFFTPLENELMLGLAFESGMLLVTVIVIAFLLHHRPLVRPDRMRRDSRGRFLKP